jgi:signal transduction histidine kinase
MIRSLRLKLSFLFLFLFLLIYGVGGAAALLVFYSGLTSALDEEIADLSEEIRPAIELKNGTPSLKEWARTATEQHLPFPAGIQIFDHHQHLLESYGLSGKSLLKGEFETKNDDGQPARLRSSYDQLKSDGHASGYLQIQMGTEARDDAVNQFGMTMLLIFPFLSVTVAFAGYFFSGLAIKPVEKSLKVLKTFVADAGHEFITPVTVVEASIQTVEETLKEHNLDLDVLDIMNRASSRMKELASDLIYLAKIDDPSAEMKMERIGVNEIVEPALEGVTELARTKGLELNCANIPDLHVHGNLYALKVVVSNLVQNAIKYTEAGGKVKVTVIQENNRVCIVVEDSGIGIPESSLEQIFDRFYRVDQSRSRAAGGSGLGLAIVKAICDRHKAEIDVVSTLGKGSKFTVRLH